MMKYTVLLLAGFALTCCSREPPTNFYTLAPVESSAFVSANVMPVTVGTINLPAILDRTQLVRRPSPDQIAVQEYDRWAAPLDDTIAKALTVDLEHLLPPQALIRSDGSPFDTKIGVIDVYIDRFDSDYAGHVTFDVAWTVTNGNPQKTLLRRTEHITEDAGDGSPSAMVQAMSRAIGDLSTRIATQLPTK
jgi:uncharacterized lipoprotein YmbA